jgi:hypothetical protein
VDGQSVERRVQPPGRGRARLTEQPPPFGGETTGRVGLARVAERAHGTVEQPGERLDGIVGRRSHLRRYT